MNFGGLQAYHIVLNGSGNIGRIILYLIRLRQNEQAFQCQKGILWISLFFPFVDSVFLKRYNNVLNGFVLASMDGGRVSARFRY